MKELFESIYALYVAEPHNSFYTGTGGRLEYAKANDSWQDNFAVLQGLSANPHDIMRTSIDDVYLQFNVFSRERESCFDHLSNCKALYDNAALTVLGHYPATLRKESEILPLWNEQGNLWQATIEFRCILQPT